MVGYPSAEELTEVLTRTTEGARAGINKVLDRETLLDLQKLVRQVPVATHVKDYAVRLVLATHPKSENRRADYQSISPFRQQPARWSMLVACRQGPCAHPGPLQCELR